MRRIYSLTTLTALLCGGCILNRPTWKGQVQWADDASRRSVVPFTEAGTALAAAAAIREMIRANPYPDLFSGCSSPEQGLDVAVYTGPSPGLYYVLVDQRFDRCGGPSVRVLDGWYEYAVTPQGEIVGRAPPHSTENASTPPIPSSDIPPGMDQTSPPATLAPGSETPPPSSPLTPLETPAGLIPGRPSSTTPSQGTPPSVDER